MLAAVFTIALSVPVDLHAQAPDVEAELTVAELKPSPRAKNFGLVCVPVAFEPGQTYRVTARPASGQEPYVGIGVYRDECESKQLYDNAWYEAERAQEFVSPTGGVYMLRLAALRGQIAYNVGPVQPSGKPKKLGAGLLPALAEQVANRSGGAGEVLLASGLRSGSDAAAGAPPARPGVFVTADGLPIGISFKGAVMTQTGPYGRGDYHRQPDGSFVLSDGSEQVRFLDADTAEFVAVGKPDAVPELVQRGSKEMQAPQLAYGLYKVIGQEDQPGGVVFKHAGNMLYWSQPASPVGNYVLKSDGKYHSQHGSGSLRIIDPYTVEYGPPQGGTWESYRLGRVGDASPTYLADESRKWDEWERGWLASEEQKNRQEDAEWEARMAEKRESDRASANSGGFFGGFMKGLSEAMASNNAMEQSMRDAANSGYASRGDDYDDSYGSGGYSSGIVIEDREEDPVPQYAEEPRQSVRGQSGSTSRALRGFTGRTCAEALKNAIYTTPGSSFEEVEREEPASGGCIVRGYLTNPQGTGGASRQ